MKQPKTQRLLAWYRESGELAGAYPTRDLDDNYSVPVLVVPEAAVKGCEHENWTGTALFNACPDCGAWREWHSASGSMGRWQRPKLLRVQR